MNTMWVLTCEVNAYYQEGEYFVAAFMDKPSKDSLRDVLKWYGDATDPLLDHVLAGGGRIDSENLWFFLNEVEEGHRYF